MDFGNEEGVREVLELPPELAILPAQVKMEYVYHYTLNFLHDVTCIYIPCSCTCTDIRNNVHVYYVFHTIYNVLCVLGMNVNPEHRELVYISKWNTEFDRFLSCASS